MAESDKDKLKKLLNDALGLKNKIRETQPEQHPELIKQLKETTAQTLDLAKSLEMEHGMYTCLILNVYSYSSFVSLFYII